MWWTPSPENDATIIETSFSNGFVTVEPANRTAPNGVSSTPRAAPPFMHPLLIHFYCESDDGMRSAFEKGRGREHELSQGSCRSAAHSCTNGRENTRAAAHAARVHDKPARGRGAARCFARAGTRGVDCPLLGGRDDGSRVGTAHQPPPADVIPERRSLIRDLLAAPFNGKGAWGDTRNDGQVGGE